MDGVRFRLSTGETDRRLAIAATKRLKAEKKSEIEAEEARRAAFGGKEPPTLGYCIARYWAEVGQFHAAPKTTWNSLEWLAEHFGSETLLHDVTGEKIAAMVAHRRTIRIRRDKETKRLCEIPCATVENATVNRYATEPLRKLFRRARDVWGYSVPYPRWGEYLLPEPQERVREAHEIEETAIIAALGEDYGRLFRFMIATGLRSAGALLTWPQVDRVNSIARIRGKRSNGQERWYTIPLTRAALAILDECDGHHQTHVFTYVTRRAQKIEGKALPKGTRMPITDSGFKTEWRRCVYDEGIAPGFRRHDTRHTTGTRFLRATGNLKATQKLLGHSRIETTLRYAHVLIDDVRAGLEQMEASTTAARNTHKNTHTRRRKSS
ncbi:tyrosine-type recombinase/integrase [Chelatococcus sambhunathii]|uniref:tyrosine-type recombinase/integrase n=1 Tax=Chelatococcus sambhunathii TaxID=363953 RepID=UPI001FD90F04|nr:tyrosine-type recombinase/integrase [Chelatococcus sambhunathii]